MSLALLAACCVVAVGLLHLHIDRLIRDAVTVLRQQAPRKRTEPTSQLAQLMGTCQDTVRRHAAVFSSAAVGLLASHIPGRPASVAFELFGFCLIWLAVYVWVAACTLGIAAYRAFRGMQPQMSKRAAAVRSFALADAGMFVGMLIAIVAYAVP